MVLQRKLCADCGATNLESETHCWACGGLHFAPEGAPPAGERTLDLLPLREPTLTWRVENPGRGRRLAALGGAFAAALLLAAIGFALGRASVSEPARAAEVAPAPAPPAIDLPPPPTESAAFPAASAVPATDRPLVAIRPVIPITAPPQVSTPVPAKALRAEAVRPGLSQPAPLWRPPAGPRPAAAPALPGAASRGAVARVVGPAAPPARETPLPSPSDTTAVVALRNETDVPVEITLEGNGSRTATIAPHSVLPLVLPPDSYRLAARSGDAETASAALALAANRSYTLVIDRAGDGSRALRLREPALETD